jgi:hydrogenase-4 component D
VQTLAPHRRIIFSAGAGLLARAHLLLLPLVLVAILESVGTFAWFLKRFGYAIPGQPSETVAAAAPLPVSMAAALATLVVLTLCSGIAASAWLA